MNRRLAWVISSLLWAGGTAALAEQSFTSGPERAMLIELYTSEGCSSCPPAETYLNGFANHSALWKEIVPIALHVDYWNYLGWEDRFSDASNTRRQHEYAQIKKQRVVYTPAFVVNGEEWRRGLFNSSLPERGPPTGLLSVSLNGNAVAATFSPAGTLSGPLDFNVAILGMDLTTEIRAGENKGRRSLHQFVSLARKHWRSDTRQWQGELPKGAEKAGAPRYALVAWVSRPNDPTPLQAVGGYLPKAP